MLKGMMCRNYDTVILSGSDNVVRNIVGAIDILTGERYGKSTIRTVENDDVSITIVSTTTNAKTFKRISGMIEEAYPNTCIFANI